MQPRLKSVIRKTRVKGAGLINSIISNLPIELHIPGYQFCGPGTKLEKRLARGDTGINPLDALCKSHDQAYAATENLSERHAADRVLLEGAKARITAPDSTFGERSAARLIRAIIGAKLMMGAGTRRRKRGIKRKRGAGIKRKKTRGAGCRRRKRRTRHGGFIWPAISTALTAYKTYKDIANAKKMLSEQQKHNRDMLARGRGLYLRPYGKGIRRRRRKTFFRIGQRQTLN